MNKQLKVWVLAGVAVVTAGVVICLRPVPQDRAYHRFADDRSWLGVPNFWNVMGNVCFLLVGVWGWMELSQRGGWTGGGIIYGVLFRGILPDSAYLSPHYTAAIWK